MEGLLSWNGRLQWNRENEWQSIGLLGELLDAGDMVAHEADEHRFRGRLAVNPVFDIVAVGIALAHFVVRLADRGDQFLAVHSNDWPAILDGLLHFRGQRIEPLHGCRALFRKI